MPHREQPDRRRGATPVYWRTFAADPILMRLSFLNGEHADFVVADGVVSLGQADGNTLVLAGRDIAPWHARIHIDARGIVLEVLDFAGRTHVNARPVREKALLRLGDVLVLGVVAMMLKPDRDDAIETKLPPEPIESGDASDFAPARVVLRGVAGSHFGHAIALRQRLVVGRAADCDIVVDDAQIAPHHASIESIGEAICLRDMGSGAGVLVNGLRVSTAVLHGGDHALRAAFAADQAARRQQRAAQGVGRRRPGTGQPGARRPGACRPGSVGPGLHGGLCARSRIVAVSPA